MNRSLFLVVLLGLMACQPAADGLAITLRLPDTLARPLDGRLILLIATDDRTEPRFQLSDGPETAQAFGLDVEGLAPGAAATFDASVFG
ncbi:MAG: hypothetical protein D6722_24565, partial [Bacteroidetes bacterium]